METNKINKIKFIAKEIKKGRLKYVIFSFFTYPLSKTRLKNWRLKKKDEILVKNLTKQIKREYDLNFLNVYSKFYCEALKEIYERKIYNFFELRKGDIIYDVGAGGGEYAILCAKKNTQCLAFELREDAYKIMNTNIELNNYQDRIKTYLGGVDNNNSLDFYFHEDKRNPTIIKIDVEGDEKKVLIGAKRILKECAPKIILETHSKKLERDCLNFLFKFGYSLKKNIEMNEHTNLLFLEKNEK